MSFHKQSAAHIYFMINCFDSLIWSSLRNKYYYYCSSISNNIPITVNKIANNEKKHIDLFSFISQIDFHIGLNGYHT